MLAKRIILALGVLATEYFFSTLRSHQADTIFTLQQLVENTIHKINSRTPKYWEIKIPPIDYLQKLAKKHNTQILNGVITKSSPNCWIGNIEFTTPPNPSFFFSLYKIKHGAFFCKSFSFIRSSKNQILIKMKFDWIVQASYKE